MPNQYKSLTDCPFFQAGDEVEIWYMRPAFFPEGIMGNSNSVDNSDLSKTHILLGSISPTLVSNGGARIELVHPLPSFAEWSSSGEAKEMLADRLFVLLQGEKWSPKGEAKELILDKGLLHTSMSVGDVIRFKNGEILFCSNTGWKNLP